MEVTARPAKAAKGKIVLTSKKINLRKYLAVFFKDFPKKSYLANPVVIIVVVQIDFQYKLIQCFESKI